MAKTLVVGTGISGKGVIDYLIKNHVEFEIFDKKTKLKGFSQAVVSAGIPMHDKTVKKIKKNKIEIMGELQLASGSFKGNVVGITGTNGKTTTTLLLSHILKTAKLNAIAMGNCGESIVKNLESLNESSVSVIEVSSYMLEKSPKFAPDIAVVLNLAEDHISHHKTFENYCATKIKMVENLNEENLAVLNCDDIEVFERTKNFKCKKLFFSCLEPTNGAYVKENYFWFNDEKLCSIKDFQLLGEHNLYNACAAICVAKVLKTSSAEICEGLKTFAPIRHRINLIGAKNGKLYVNDSKATNIASTICALKSVQGKKVLILGGHGKHECFKHLFSEQSFNVEKIVCYGEDGKRIAKELKHCFCVSEIFYVEKFSDAVRYANDKTEFGKICMLSPACASFDTHLNFEKRGEEFEEMVKHF